MQSTHMRKEWEPRHSPLIAQAVEELAQFDKKHPNAPERTLVSIIVRAMSISPGVMDKIPKPLNNNLCH